MPARTQVLLAALCFGTTGTAQALGPAGLSPAGVGAARILVGGALLVGSAGGPPRLRRGPRLVAAAGVAAYQLCFFAAVADTGVAVGTIVALGSAPAMAGACEWALQRRARAPPPAVAAAGEGALERRPPTRTWAAATGLAAAGVAMLALAGADASISPV